MTGAPFRLAFREELPWWVCYLAKPHTMDDAIEVARIRRAAVNDPNLKAIFIDLCQKTIETGAAELGHPVESWGKTEIAPGHERRQ